MSTTGGWPTRPLHATTQESRTLRTASSFGRKSHGHVGSVRRHRTCTVQPPTPFLPSNSSTHARRGESERQSARTPEAPSRSFTTHRVALVRPHGTPPKTPRRTRRPGVPSEAALLNLGWRGRTEARPPRRDRRADATQAERAREAIQPTTGSGRVVAFACGGYSDGAA